MRIPWTAFKGVLTARNIPAHGAEDGENYYLQAIDGSFRFECVLPKSNPNDDLADFETNFKATMNTRIDPKDADGSTIFRGKSTRVGWHYQPRWISFTTGVYNSVHNMKADTITDYGDVTLHFYKIVSGAWVELKRSDYATDALFQTELVAECTLTCMDWYAQFDFDIRGGVFLNGVRAAVPSYGYIVVAPDVPASLGGSVPFLDGGIPLHLLPDYGYISQDAGTVKSFTFDASAAKSNKIRLIIDHPLGNQVDLAMAFQIYRL